LFLRKIQNQRNSGYIRFFEENPESKNLRLYSVIFEEKSRIKEPLWSYSVLWRKKSRITEPPPVIVGSLKQIQNQGTVGYL
jgi:hypothetical protein